MTYTTMKRRLKKDREQISRYYHSPAHGGRSLTDILHDFEERVLDEYRHFLRERERRLHK